MVCLLCYFFLVRAASVLPAVHSCALCHSPPPPDFVSTNPLALMETINPSGTFWGMTYGLLLWRGRAGRDRKMLHQSYKDEEVLLRMKIIKEKKKANLTFIS